MNKPSRAEQLSLPEQLYLLLVDAESGKPCYRKRTVERVLGVAVLWELFHLGAIAVHSDDVVGLRTRELPAGVLTDAAAVIERAGLGDAGRLVLKICAELHPVWEHVGRTMTAGHLTEVAVRRRFLLFHQTVVRELDAAREESGDLGEALVQTATRVWDPTYDADLATTHPRLLARLVILDNYHLLKVMLGEDAYAAVAESLAALHGYVAGLGSDAAATRAKRPEARSADRGDGGWFCSGCSACGSVGAFWTDGPLDSDGTPDAAGDGAVDSGDGGGDGGGGDGGGGGCDGCGGCGGCG